MDGAGRKWLQLAFDILSYEFGHTKDGQLLSEGADRLIERFPISGRVFIFIIGQIITFHLANLVKEKYDVMATSFWKSQKHGV